MKSARARWASSVAAIAWITACGEPPPTQFVAFDRDFSDFRRWPRVEVNAPPTLGHPSGPRYVYRAPRAPTEPSAPRDGGGAFAVGTILVKSIEAGEPASWRVFAMVKRGEGYNQDGARGWEFFELAVDAQERVSVRARGVRPGVAYDESTGVELTCNDCHGTASARARDSVLTDGIAP